MASTCIDELLCTAGCLSELPDVEFDICNPKVHFGQISDLFITNVGYPMVDETDPIEWSTRLLLPSTNPARIIRLQGIGDKPLAETNNIEISYGRTVSGNKTHTVNFTIDETSDKNYEMMRKFECNKSVLVWYKTYEGKLYGGKHGVVKSGAIISFGHAIPNNASELETLPGTIKWKAKFHPCRSTWPLQTTGIVTPPTP